MRIHDAHRLLGPIGTELVASETMPGLMAELDRVGISSCAASLAAQVLGDPTLREETVEWADLSTGRIQVVPVLAPVPHTGGWPDNLDQVLALRPPMVRACPARHRWSLRSRTAEQWWQRLAAAGIPLCLSVAEVGWGGLGSFLGDHRDLKVFVVGATYRELRQCAELLNEHENAWLETGPLNTAGALEWLVAGFGAHRLIFGSGAPLQDDAGPARLLGLLELPTEDVAQIAHGSWDQIVGAETDDTSSATVREPEPHHDTVSVLVEPAPRPTLFLDAHAHLGSWHDFYLPEPEADWYVRQLDKIGMTAAGVSHLVSLHRDSRRGDELALAAADTYPGRFGVYLVGDPHDPQCPDRLRDLLQHPHVWGIKIHPTTHMVPIGDPRYELIAAIAAEAGVTVLCHTSFGHPMCGPEMLAQVAVRHPGAHFLIGHGGLLPMGFEATARLARDTPNLYFETSGSTYTRRWIRRIVDIAGPQNVVYGSDGLFLEPRIAAGRLFLSDLSEPEINAVGGGTLAGLLGQRLVSPSLPATSSSLVC